IRQKAPSGAWWPFPRTIEDGTRSQAPCFAPKTDAKMGAFRSGKSELLQHDGAAAHDLNMFDHHAAENGQLCSAKGQL
ncbi:MAG: hypothetical protein WCO83_13640, partial [Alphaproteobacteria bacterium]